MGNLRSVYQAFHHVAPDDNILIAHQPEEIATADRVVLPGQGAMPDCMKHLEESGLLEALLEAAKNKPLLGVCVGEQMLCDRSAEVRASESSNWTECLGLIPGEVRRFELVEKNSRMALLIKSRIWAGIKFAKMLSTHFGLAFLI